MDVLTKGRLGFGLFEANLSARELYRRGALVRVQAQPFQVLALLLARPGEVVTREELRKQLWPGDTFVDFDEGLNSAIKKLRYALGDSSENPRFIETIPRRGYRFIAPLRTTDGSTPANSPLATQEVAIRFGNDFHAEGAMHFSIVIPSGLRDLSLSRDGRRLAFIAPVPEHRGTHLWVNEIGAAESSYLESTEGASYPFWSPDSHSIAFFAEGKLKRIAASGGPVQVICDAPVGRGGSWNESGVIVFAPLNGSAICRVRSGGGSAELVPGFEHTVTATRCNRWVPARW